MAPAFNRWNSSEGHVLLHGHGHLVGKYSQGQCLDAMPDNILVCHIPAVELSLVKTIIGTVYDVLYCIVVY